MVAESQISEAGGMAAFSRKLHESVRKSRQLKTACDSLEKSISAYEKAAAGFLNRRLAEAGTDSELSLQEKVAKKEASQKAATSGWLARIGFSNKEKAAKLEREISFLKNVERDVRDIPASLDIAVSYPHSSVADPMFAKRIFAAKAARKFENFVRENPLPQSAESASLSPETVTAMNHAYVEKKFSLMLDEQLEHCSGMANPAYARKELIAETSGDQAEKVKSDVMEYLASLPPDFDPDHNSSRISLPDELPWGLRSIGAATAYSGSDSYSRYEDFSALASNSKTITDRREAEKALRMALSDEKDPAAKELDDALLYHPYARAERYSAGQHLRKIASEFDPVKWETFEGNENVSEKIGKENISRAKAVLGERVRELLLESHVVDGYQDSLAQQRSMDAALETLGTPEDFGLLFFSKFKTHDFRGLSRFAKKLSAENVSDMESIGLHGVTELVGIIRDPKTDLSVYSSPEREEFEKKMFSVASGYLRICEKEAHPMLLNIVKELRVESVGDKEEFMQDLLLKTTDENVAWVLFKARYPDFKDPNHETQILLQSEGKKRKELLEFLDALKSAGIRGDLHSAPYYFVKEFSPEYIAELLRLVSLFAETEISDIAYAQVAAGLLGEEKDSYLESVLELSRYRSLSVENAKKMADYPAESRAAISSALILFARYGIPDYKEFERAELFASLTPERQQEYTEAISELAKRKLQSNLSVERFFALPQGGATEYIAGLSALQDFGIDANEKNADKIYVLPPDRREAYISILASLKENGVSPKFDFGDRIELLSPDKRQEYVEILGMCAKNGIAVTIENADRFASFPPEKREEYISIIQRIKQSPSQEIKRISEQLLGLIIETDDPAATYEEVESIFIKNNLPLVGKTLRIFELLYPADKIRKSITERSSPVLAGTKSARRLYDIFYKDLLKVNIGSANPSLRNYLSLIREGEPLLSAIERGESLDEMSERKAGSILGKLEMLSGASLLGKKRKGNGSKGSFLGERLSTLRKNMLVPDDQSVSERISEMFLKPLGKASITEVLDEMDAAVFSADSRGRHLFENSKEGRISLAEGDLIKGVDSSYIKLILENGSVAREFLGASAGSDQTPFDTDLSRISGEDASLGFEGAFKNSLAKGYGTLHFILKDRGQFQKTEAKNPGDESEVSPRFDQGKLELFQSGYQSDRHYGIRTGFPATEIDCIIFGGNESIDNVLLEIAKNGYYIPVADETGKIIFSPEDYDRYRKVFAGIPRFGNALYAVRQTGAEYAVLAGEVESMELSREAEEENVRQAYAKIRGLIGGALKKNKIDLNDDFSESLVGAELLDTGSTGRNTNLPGDYDFDLSLRLDSESFKKTQDIRAAIRDSIKLESEEWYSEGDYFQFRAKGVSEIGGVVLEKPIDIDIGFSSKNELAVYGSHDAIRDKLSWVRENLGTETERQVVANILAAKKILKEGNAYKKQENGGFGGIGTENWILAHGGSISEAFRSFRDAATEEGRTISLEDFKEKYHVFDAGINVKTSRRDDFIRKLKEEGYRAMLATIKKNLV